jgi:Multiubiquitin
MTPPTSAQNDPQQREYEIHIDSVVFKVPSPSLSGAALRQLPSPPLGPDVDLWEDVPGGADVLVGDDQVVELKEGMHFFTAPANINPGAS